MQLSQGKSSWRVHATWALVPFVFLILVLGVAPGRGAGWVIDDGLFLSSAWNAANGFGLDRMLPQQPVYLINSLLMKLGMIELLHFRYAYYVLGLLSSTVFFMGLDRRRFLSPIVPIAICVSLLVAFSSIIISHVLFLLGAGCYFFAIDASSRKRTMLLALSGLLFAVTGFLHICYVIAMVLLIGIILIVDRSSRRSLLGPCFLLGTLVLWGSYIYWLGITNLIATPAGHDTSIRYLTLNVGRIILTYLLAISAYVLALKFLKKQGAERFANAQLILSALVTFYYGAQFYGAQLISHYADLLTPWLSSHASGLLHKALWNVVHVPGAIFYLLLFAIFRWIGEEWTAFTISSQSFDTKKNTESNCIRPRLSNFTVTASKFIVSINNNALNQKLTIAVMGLLLLVSGYAAGSASNFYICMSAISGPAIGLLVILWSTLDQKITYFVKFLLTIWIGIFTLFALTINLPTFEPIFSQDKILLVESPLKGILVQPSYVESLSRLRELYKENGCQNLPLISLEYIPMVYYILQHSIPNSFGIPRPEVYFPENQIMESLNLQDGWCVLDATTKNTRSDINRKHGLDIRDSIRDFVSTNSERVFLIPSPSDDLSDVRLFIHDPMGLKRVHDE